jgi:hypothetical protein
MALFWRLSKVSFYLLTTSQEDESRWAGLLKRLDQAKRDIHFLPQYGRVYERTYGYKAFLAVFESGSDFILQPFVRRNLNELPFLKDQGITSPYFDITNPYGYGGPLCSNDCGKGSEELLTIFDREFTNYCIDQRFASEFTSLHPLLGNHKILERTRIVSVNKEKEIVYVDLRLSEKDIWNEYSRGQKSNINKAIRNGVTVKRLEPNSHNLKKFNELYYETMKRNGATLKWFFPDQYFQNCCELLGSERTSLFVAYVEDQPAAMYLLMHDFNTVYYHFAGTDSNYFVYRPNNLLMHHVSIWAKNSGYLYYHLGGGVSALQDDNLFGFKASFSRNAASLYSYGRVLHQETYEKLCRIKREHETWSPFLRVQNDYFPAYRS